MRASAQKDWTVMVYLAGDNELNDDMAATLTRLHSLRGNPGCNIFAYYATTNLPRKAVLYDFREKKKHNEPLKACERLQLGSASSATMENSADVRTLKGFIQGCRQVSRTPHNVLILSGHSDAFLGRSLLQDETSMRVMSFRQLKLALEEAIQDLDEKKLDILGFDSCAMGLVEVVFELRRCAKVLVAPQDFTPASGWNYDKMLFKLTSDNPDSDPVVHARNFVKEYICAQRDFVVGGRSVELAATRLDADFEHLADKINSLADLLRVELPIAQSPEVPGEDGTFGDDEVGNTEPGVWYSRFIALILCSHWFSQTHMQDQTVDLCRFCLNLFLECEKLRRQIEVIRGHKPIGEEAADTDVRGLDGKLGQIKQLCLQIISIMRGANGIVIDSNHAGNLHQFSTGLSMFFPWSRLAFVLAYPTYKELEFIKRTGASWLSLINRFTAETMLLDPEKISGPLDVFGEGFSSRGEKYNPPGRGALASFREKFGKVKNYPMEDLNEPRCE